MRFDRKGPEGGFEISTTLSSGKAFLECKAYLQQEEVKEVTLLQSQKAYLDIRIWDRENKLVFCCRHPLWQEEPARGLILHPHLWQGTEDPYLYRVRAALMESEACEKDVLEKSFAIRNLCEIALKGWFLNDRPFEIRAVEYEIPTVDASRERIRRELELIQSVGANAICPTGGASDGEFCRLCDEVGLILWQSEEDECGRNTVRPSFCGGTDSLVNYKNDSPTDCYYYYKACWSKEPFVYISIESLTFQRNGNVQVTVYSNQRKVALYVEGVLFEFRTEGPDFVFQEIPVKQFPVMLTAETGECSMSVTAYPVHTIYTE